MLKKAKKNRIGKRVMAWVLTCVMMLSLVGVMPESVWADGETPTSWDFTTGTDNGTQFQSNSGTYNGLEVDATSGKFAIRGSDVQINAGTKVKIPVPGDCTIKVVAYNAGYAAGITFTGLEATVSDATVTTEYTGKAGTVEMAITAQTYIFKIEVIAKEPAPTSWDFTTGADNGTQFQSNSGTYNGLEVDATSGKFAIRGSDVQINAGTKVKIPVPGDCTINVVAYSAGYTEGITFTGLEKTVADATVTTEYTGKAGTVEMAITAQTYIFKIEVVEKEKAPMLELDGAAVTWDFRDKTSSLYSKLASDDGILKITTATGTLGCNGSQHGADSKDGTILSISAPAGKTTVVVSSCAYSKGTIKLQVNGEDVTDAVDAKMGTDGEEVTLECTTTEDGVIDVVFSGQNYIHYVKASTVYVEPITSEDFFLNVDDLIAALGAIKTTETTKAGTDNYFSVTKDFTLENKSGKTFTVDGVEITTVGRMKSGGDSSAEKRSIHFTVTAGTSGRVVACVASSSSTADAHLVLCDASGKVVQSFFVERGKSSAVVFEGLAAGDYYLGSLKTVGESVVEGAVNFFYVKVTETSTAGQPTVTTATATQDASDATGATVNVAITGAAGKEDSAYLVEASKDGEKWIKVGTVDGTLAEGSLVVDLATKDLGFGTWQFRVSASNTVVADASIVYAPKTYTLTGTFSGLEDAALLTGLTFTATTDSLYTVPAVTIDTAAGTYSVVLEQGTSYKVAGVGVDEYDMIAPTGEFTYSADATLDITFQMKKFYEVTIVLGTTPDLTGKEVSYSFTHEDGTVYDFGSDETIKLRDGVYTVAVKGDINKMAYGISTGKTLKVNGASMTHVVKFSELTSWSFADVIDKVDAGNTGWFQGIEVDATAGGGFKNNGDKCCSFVGTNTVLKVPVTGPCSITVTSHKSEAQYAKWTVNGVEATEGSITVEYTGEAGTIDIVSSASSYVATITLIYPPKDVVDVEFEEQPVMPFVPEDDTDENTAADTDGNPRQNKKDSLYVQPVGQKLLFSQTGGKFADKFADTKDVAYYLFPMTAEKNKLEFDLLVTESKATGNEAGFFGGVFTDNYVYSLGLRAGGQKIRGIYSKNGGINGGSFAGAGSPNEELVGLNREIHYCIEFNGEKPVVTITFVDDAGVTQTRSWTQGALAEPDGSAATEFYYGFAFANISATITNMLYTSADGKTVYYDQNACYYTEGKAPVASEVKAEASESREYITITWKGTLPEADGTYVVEMQKDGGEWVELTQDATGFTHVYTIPAGDGGNYLFRVCGQLGKEPLGGTRNEYATMANTIYVKGALPRPVVTLTPNAEKKQIVLNWQEVAKAEYYMVYRYSSDEGAENAKCIAEKVTATTYTDTTVEVDVPYYYQVIAISEADDNQSPLSVAVWDLVASERDGDYVYEDAATQIAITKKSYDTVFTNKVVLEGIIYGEGTLTAFVNGTKADAKDVKARDKFAFELTVVPGRNDVNIFFEDKDGNITRKTFNFVYLTNYDVIVDAAYTGTDGELVDGIPTFKTVQAAVDAAGKAKASDRTVILVMAGSYEERLVVNTANITLIGEDRENTLIHCYPADILNDSKAEAGEDMTMRCATYIQPGAKGFTAENLTFANDYVYSTPDGKSNKSADAIRVEADNTVFVNVGFDSVQDTLYMHSGKQYYYKCVIKGLIDFIYCGDKAQAYFNDCEIIFVYEQTKNAGYVSAPKTAEDSAYGLTFNNCVITAEDGCTGSEYLLARPWGATGNVNFINCYMGKAINKIAPYKDWNCTVEESRFYECGTYGPGYLINTDRKQISPAKAAELTSAAGLGWDPVKSAADLSANYYVGSVTTDKESGTAEEEVTEDKYLWTDGDDTGLKIYDMEGFADAYGVTGGGLLLETNPNYHKVATAEEFLTALLKAKNEHKSMVIELTADINLGCNEVENYGDYSKIIKAHSAQPLTHPTLIESGVSQLSLEGFGNLTIFSLNGSSIKHTTITMKKSSNIMIRNIKFDELWEWDEATEGDYDRNDWDYITIDSGCDGIWIDHCSFYKAYDGVVDMKNPAPVTNATVSWCEFLPGSENNVFFDAQMNDIYKNPDKYPTYKKMLDSGMTKEQIYKYAYGQKKTHLLGQSDDATSAAGLQITFANNHYLNSMDRMPRLRYGIAHVYNCVMDAQEMLDARLSIKDPDFAKKIVSNGAASTCGAQLLLENCFISGIQDALNSGNGSSPAGYINAINSVYYMHGIKTDLVVKNKTSADDDVLITDADAFIASLPYDDYVLYDAEELRGIVPYYAGAGKLELTALQWEKVSYNTDWKDPVVNEIPELPTKGDMDASVIYLITLLGAAFAAAGFFGKKKFATEE